jgi:hypothetical protein
VAVYQFGKRLVGPAFRILPQQRTVIRWLHLRISVRHPAGPDKLFADLEKRYLCGSQGSGTLECSNIH